MGRGNRSASALNQTAPRQSKGARLRGSVAGQEIIAQIVTDNRLVSPIVDRLATLDEVAIDFETTCDEGSFDDNYGPDKGRIRLIQIGYDNPKTGRREQLLFDSFSVDISPLGRLIENPDVRKIVHYSPFEAAWARHHLGAEFENMEDTCFAAQSINKELRSRVAKELSPDNVQELQSLLSKPADVYELEDGRWFGRAEVETATGKVITNLQEQLKDEGHADLAESMESWSCSENAKLSSITNLYLSEELPKEEQASDWGEPNLSESQLLYAAGDCAVTLTLGEKMRNIARTLGVEGRVAKRIELDRERALKN